MYNNRGAPNRGALRGGHTGQAQRPRYHPQNAQFQRRAQPPPVYQQPRRGRYQRYQANPYPQQQFNQPPLQGPPQGYGNPQGYYPQQPPGGYQGYQRIPNPQQQFYQPPFHGPPQGYRNPQGHFLQHDRPQRAPRLRQPDQLPRGPRPLVHQQGHHEVEMNSDRLRHYRPASSFHLRSQRLLEMPPPQFALVWVPEFPRSNLQQMERHWRDTEYVDAPIIAPDLDKLPHPLWGTEDEKQATLSDCNDWLQENPQGQNWLAWNVVMMDGEQFRSTITTINGRDYMMGIYKFSAYVRMHNWMMLSDDHRDYCMACVTVPWPGYKPPGVVDLEWFRGPRCAHQHLEVTEKLAQAYLDRETEITSNLYRDFNNVLPENMDSDTAHWIAANILGKSSKSLLSKGKIVKTHNINKQVKRRMRNWLKLHETWRREFMEIAFVPFPRDTVKWDEYDPGELDCLEDSPDFNPTLKREINSQHGSVYLHKTRVGRFSEDQTEYLYHLWVRRNMRHRLWAGTNVDTMNKMENWLRLHTDWKEFFIKIFRWPDL